MKRIYLILAVLLIVSTNNIHAQSTSSLNRELQNNIKEQEDINKKIIMLDKKINNTNKEIEDSNIKLEEINNKIEKVNKDIQELE